MQGLSDSLVGENRWLTQDQMFEDNLNRDYCEGRAFYKGLFPVRQGIFSVLVLINVEPLGGGYPNSEGEH